MESPLPICVRSTDDVTVVAHDHGGDGPPVVFCHATGFHGRYWDPVCRSLADRWRCVAIDLRGHGDSVIPAGLDLDWRGMADDILAVIDALALSRVHAAGHSMGGCAIILAELARPGSIDHAWLFEPILATEDRERFFPGGGPNPLAESARRRREVFGSRDEAYERYRSRPPFSRVDPAALRAYVDFGFRNQADGTVILKCRGEIEALVFDHAVTDAFTRLGDVGAMITIAGSGDDGAPAAMAPVAAEALRHGRFEAWPDLTHFAPMEDPVAIASAIDAALRSR